MMKVQNAVQTDRQLAAAVLRAESAAVAQVAQQLDEGFDKAVAMLAECRGTVIVAGMGKSGIIAQKISATLASTGTPSHFLHPVEAMHGDLGRVRAGDVVVLLSYSGNTEDILALAALLRQDRVPIVAVCGRADSHLGRLADACLCIGDVDEACPHNLAPTASTTAMLALGDALALAVSRRKNFSADDFRKRHPGGSLGRQMMGVSEILRFRADENLPILSDRLTVQQVLVEADRQPRRAGALILVDEAGRLSGLFTDADLRRMLMREGPAVLSRPIAQIMTRSPRCLNDTAVVKDAVQLVRELRVDEIPVVNADGKPVGLIDVQDLIALKVIEE